MRRIAAWLSVFTVAAVMWPLGAHGQKLVALNGTHYRAGQASVFGDRSYGIATRCYECRFALGFWLLANPRHGFTITRQTDWGPSWSLSWREFDLTRDEANTHGYSYGGFPTDEGRWWGVYIGARIPRGLRYGHQSGGRPYHGWAPFRRRMEWHSLKYWRFINAKYLRHQRLVQSRS